MPRAGVSIVTSNFDMPGEAEYLRVISVRQTRQLYHAAGQTGALPSASASGGVQRRHTFWRQWAWLPSMARFVLLRAAPQLLYAGQQKVTERQ
jgi:hypothetical protein